MAEAFLNQLAKGKANPFDKLTFGSAQVQAGVNGISAGTQPADKVNPVVAEAMKEIGIDISGNKPKALTLEMVEQADKMITMGCGDSSTSSEQVQGLCPAKIIETEDWALDDPKGQPLEKVRQIRDEVKARVTKLLGEIA